jgi:hypothetical protein
VAIAGILRGERYMAKNKQSICDFGENLDANLELGRRLAEVYCTDQCQEYHINWFNRRAEEGKRSSPLITTPILLSQFATSVLLCDFRNSHMINILICGSADTKLLALVDFVLDSYGIYRRCDVTITVTDACMTPLKLCEAFAEDKDFKLRLLHGFMPGSIKGLRADIVVMSGVLQFIEPTAQVTTLLNIRENIDHGGHLVFSHSYNRNEKARENANYGFASATHIKNLFEICGLKIISEVDAKILLPFGHDSRRLRSRFAAILESVGSDGVENTPGN